MLKDSTETRTLEIDTANFLAIAKVIYREGFSDGWTVERFDHEDNQLPITESDNYQTAWENSIAKRKVEKIIVEHSGKLEVVTCVYCGHAYPPGTPTANHPLLTEHIARCEKHPMRAVVQERDELQSRLAKIAALLETAVCTVEPDKGVVLLSDYGTTHTEIVNGRPIQVYDHEYFSPLGDALIAAWHLAKGEQP